LLMKRPKLITAIFITGNLRIKMTLFCFKDSTIVFYWDPSSTVMLIHFVSMRFLLIISDVQFFYLISIPILWDKRRKKMF
jgi:hypothetical protein